MSASAAAATPPLELGVLRFADHGRGGYRRRTATSTPVEDPRAGEAQLLRSLREGDERAFAQLLAEYDPAMLRVAKLYVGSRAVAEEVVQDAWLGVIAGLPRFE